MKIVFYGDSITDCGRNREGDGNLAYGAGYVMQAAGRLFEKNPKGYEIINTGINGNRIVDLYSRIKADLWNHEPDVISILIGVNDISHEVYNRNGVELERFERIYDMLLEDTKKVLPRVKIMLCEPFVLEGTITAENMDKFGELKKYSTAIKKLSEKHGCYFVPLQDMISELGEKYGNKFILRDGVHPTVHGAVFLAKKWLSVFEELEKDING